MIEVFSALAVILSLFSLWTSNPRTSVGAVACSNAIMAVSYTCAYEGGSLTAISGASISLASAGRQFGVLWAKTDVLRLLITITGAIIGIVIILQHFEPIGSSLAAAAYLCGCGYTYCTLRKTQRLWSLPGSVCLGTIAALSHIWLIVALNTLALGINLYGLARGK